MHTACNCGNNCHQCEVCERPICECFCYFNEDNFHEDDSEITGNEKFEYNDEEESTEDNEW